MRSNCKAFSQLVIEGGGDRVFSEGKLGKGMYWLVLCQLDTAGVITETGASVEEMPP